ncbi:PADRE domain - like 10 [Theobroma cacao]|uniref:Uncharacterized protein LOC18595395 n=2 Tax=Theobroma cacao TaxID=3641 RepID=A0AB32WHM9_THECC|nr:PREDICTED: uncharacterized protein LOC18595395 [Theobroma cacao]XP_017978468.1 PREDICTED: uncharacterized protein LOC18595395 [Theobroma cacao]XP_017978469.1 PREDICTED: uncharacterized protein LOC18595395 [Theobroma cacao]EOY25998.1 Beta-3 adrenergic receptor, putative [Theobroma cacao]WRX26989.1 PADRE domain - like 10 [Theobroma cacao]
MVFSNWICTKNTKNMFVKIVHPGGHVELHDRPVLAAEIICRNPRCVVAHPHVFQQPWSIVAPETVLMPGQKFYVVPLSTIRKLQRLSNKHSPFPDRQTPPSKSQKSEEPDPDSDNPSICWFFMQKNTLKNPYSSINHLDDEGANANSTDSKGEKGVSKDMVKDGSCFSDKNCFTCMITGVKTKANGDDSGEETRSSSNFVPPETRGHTRKRTRRHAKGSPKRHAAFDQWQPSLASINETEE